MHACMCDIQNITIIQESNNRVHVKETHSSVSSAHIRKKGTYCICLFVTQAQLCTYIYYKLSTVQTSMPVYFQVQQPIFWREW